MRTERLRQALLGFDRWLARERLRPVPFVLLVASGGVWLLSWTPVLTAMLGRPWALLMAIMAPPAFGAAAWLRAGRSLIGALSWTIPFTALTVVAYFAPRPLDAIVLFVAAWFWVSMLFFGRVINWWEAKILRSCQYGRLPREEQAFDDELEGLLDVAIAHGTQFERRRTDRDELRARLEETRRHVLALRPPNGEWDEARRALLEFVTAAIQETTSDRGSSEQSKARERAVSALRAYQETRGRLHRDRLQPWRGFELM